MNAPAIVHPSCKFVKKTGGRLFYIVCNYTF